MGSNRRIDRTGPVRSITYQPEVHCLTVIMLSGILTAGRTVSRLNLVMCALPRETVVVSGFFTVPCSRIPTGVLTDQAMGIGGAG